MAAQPQPQIKKGYADTLYGQIHYRYVLPASETNKKPAIMLHKSASSSASYEALMLQLVSNGYPCYAPDMPGFGNSFDPMPEVAEDILTNGTRWYVEAFVSAFTGIGIMGNAASKVHLIGHHSGASLAPELAALYPDMVEDVTLIGTAVMDANERAAMKKKYFAPFNQPVQDGSHLLKTWDYLRTMGVGGDIDLFQREAVDHIRAWKGRNQIYGAVWDQDLASYLDTLQCPILFICAKDDVLWDYQEKAKKRWTKATYCECKGANFSPDLDSQAIAQAWLSFIESPIEA
ncbi:hypothetical protein S40288_07993 [Stachybotrys chartarum IBT 40288]|nr:hypothetical protein S40288_07993 [Stachybotrys chartarum IBT 40288]